MKIILMIIGLTLIEGCSTVTPETIVPDQGRYDSTVPRQYDQARGGFCDFVVDDHGTTQGALYTAQAIARYRELLSRYRLQLKADVETDVLPTDGIRRARDQYGNQLCFIDVQHLVYFLKMERWNTNKLPEDSIWLKLKEATK